MALALVLVPEAEPAALALVPWVLGAVLAALALLVTLALVLVRGVPAEVTLVLGAVRVALALLVELALALVLGVPVALALVPWVLVALELVLGAAPAAAPTLVLGGSCSGALGLGAALVALALVP